MSHQLQPQFGSVPLSLNSLLPMMSPKLPKLLNLSRCCPQRLTVRLNMVMLENLNRPHQVTSRLMKSQRWWESNGSMVLLDVRLSDVISCVYANCIA